MAEKDRWDKAEVLIKLIGSVFLVMIPIAIKVGADRISQSMERAKLVDSLLADLTDEEKKMRRDLALIALDAAVSTPQRCAILGLFGCGIDEAEPDLVADVALVLWRELDDRSEQTEAARIIKRRKPETHAQLLVSGAEITSAVDVEAPGPPMADLRRRAQTSEILAELLAPAAPVRPAEQALSGIRLIYLQYAKDKDHASRVQRALREQGVSVPGIERVDNIQRNDIRYASAADRPVAERLRVFLQETLRIDIAEADLIDLSTQGYKVPPGQFEVWLKD